MLKHILQASFSEHLCIISVPAVTHCDPQKEMRMVEWGLGGVSLLKPEW